MLAVTELSETFQIEIPEKIRTAQDWHSGQRLAFVPHGRSYLLVAVPTIDELFGIAEGANTDDIRDRRDRY